MPSRRLRGFTVVELMACLAVAAILLKTAVPSLLDQVARARLQGALNELSIDLHYARSQAVRERRAITVSTTTSGNGYTLRNASATLKTVSLPVGVVLTPNLNIAFDALRGMADAATIEGGSSGTSASLRVTVNTLGRVQLCSPAASFVGYPEC